jgi:hypothetical protein
MMREEEEETPYMQDDLHGDFEFKILRSNTAAFRKPEMLQQALEEEALAGWVLLEKLDNSRLRLKRKRGSGHRDATAAIDPYRTYFGLGNGAIAAIVIGVIAAVLGVVATIVAILA